ncbi:amidase domain-containing protein [Clostridium estertheticum]|uniref:amidase domain-containing protein n=1 Tax=Clostridium estertheticum TaxID=238834 RepID=UPI001C6EB19B|nr:amidase domain-containing protein [Clostridium estertheticum]MBW9152726.1 amidase domain-containing protein [Clostridium estertheticum]WLC85688.1 amidase domain-containing protein [Clostridium estertheticum]
MNLRKIEKSQSFKLKLLIFVILLLSMQVYISSYANTITDESKKEVTNYINQIFKNRNKAILNGDLELIQSFYNMDTKYGTWAYEYEKKKMDYINNWAEKQGIKFTDIVPTLIIKRIKENNNNFSIYLLCSTEYKYIYIDQPKLENTSRIGTYHNLQLMSKDGSWVISKEWYKDPFANSLDLSNIKADSIKEYILFQKPRDLKTIGQRRIDAVKYADKYCGAASDSGYKYNMLYRDYNPQGGDCANFASQILFEGGKFRKNSTWNSDKNGATKGWLNADSFKRYMIYSGRASVIAYGSYDKVYKASYKLLPGDIVAYEKKNDITHISVVTGADSRGYSLVSCHNSDRSKVPWDLGWSDKNIKFWLIRVHF